MAKNNELVNRKKMEHVAAAAGAGLGVGAASAIGTVVGGSGILGSIGSIFGLTIAATTPVGWLIGGAVAGGVALRYGSKAMGLKGKSDGINETMANGLDETQRAKMQEIGAKLAQGDINIAKNLWSQISEKKLADTEVIKEITNALEIGATSSNEAIVLACDVLGFDVSDYLSENQLSIDELLTITALSAMMMAENGEVKKEEVDVFFNLLSQFYGIEEQDAGYILDYTLENINKMIEEAGEKDIDSRIILLCFAESFSTNKHLHKQVLTILEAIGKVDGDFDED